MSDNEDNIVVSDKGRVDTPNIKPSVTKNKLPKKIILLAGLSLIVLILVASGLFYFLSKNTNKTAKDSCGGEILETSAAILNPLDMGKVQGLDTVAKTIMEIEGYEKYPNCLYPVIEYYISIGDSQNAIDTFKKFESVYGDGASFAGERFGTNLDMIKEQITRIEEQIERRSSGEGTLNFGPTNTDKQNQGTQ